MLIKYLISIVAFYFLAVFQNSFFASFSQFGVTPNLVVVLFFILIFFEKGDKKYPIAFYAASAGFFLDIFSSEYFGISAVLLFIEGMAIKKIHFLLSEKNNKYSFAYFISLFFIFLIFYEVFWEVYFYALYRPEKLFNFSVKGSVNMIFNLLLASFIFMPYQKAVKNMLDRQYV